MTPNNVHYLIHAVICLGALSMKYFMDAKIVALETRIRDLEKK